MWVAVLVLLAALATGKAAAQVPQAAGRGSDEGRAVVRLLSTQGEELLQTGIALRVGDRFVSPDDRVFEVVRVDRGVATARPLGRRDGPAAWRPAAWRPVFGAPPVSLAGMPWPNGDLAARGRGLRVAIYHTHSDESYLPDSGRTNEPWNGDILGVGAAMARVLRGHGLDVLHSARRHDPHDGLAYLRSRRTALSLLRRGADALFDVHRDTPPASVYLRRIAGQMATSVLLVLGRQNPHLRANEAFAFTIKGYADRAYPGLIRGILYAAGDYNQDLFPRSMLAEVGSTYNRVDHARSGARLFGNVVAATLTDIVPAPGLPAPEVGAARGRESRRGWEAAGVLVALVTGGVALYLIVNEHSYEWLAGLLSRLREARRTRPCRDTPAKLE